MIHCWAAKSNLSLEVRRYSNKARPPEFSLYFYQAISIRIKEKFHIKKYLCTAASVQLIKNVFYT